METSVYKPGTLNSLLARILSRRIEANKELVSRVAEIVEGVRAGGDEALIHYTEKFDGIVMAPRDLRVAADTLRGVAAQADPGVTDAFRRAIHNVRAFHERQRESGWRIAADGGSTLGMRVLPVQTAGLYVPGGGAAYPSTLIMNAVPAQAAGVARIVVATPPASFRQAPVIAAVLLELGLEEVYQVGGAQAIAALAFGTETIPRVDKVVGPGSAYVAIAKKLVYGSAGVDSIAGPTEVVVLADQSADPRFVAADLLAQAEHSEDASAICVTTSASLAREVTREIDSQIASLDRSAIARASIQRYGAVFVVESIETGCELVNSLAPEHLELMTVDNERVMELIENAGAIFLGPWSPEPVGDYFAGPNHVLPTAGTARFASPLGVYDFVKRQSIIDYGREALARSTSYIAAMADAEGLTAHKQAVLLRARAQSSSERAGVDPLKKVKPAVRALSAYSLTPHRTTVKLNQNENPFDMPAEIKEEVARRLSRRAWSRYPDFVPSTLLARLAEFAAWRPDGILAGNGSNELIQAALMVTIGPRTRVVISEPTFALYRQIATVLGGEVVNVPLTGAFEYDKVGIAARLRQGADVLILCSPNNPTGCLLPREHLIQLARSFDGIVVVDEAYHEFSGQTVVPLLAELPNLIVLRTFSKAMAMAGMRVGYLLSSPDLTREVRKATLPYNLNVFSSTAAEVACERYDLLKPQIDLIVGERERLRRSLDSIPGVNCVPSSANFMLIQSPIEPSRLFEQLLARDILVRDVSRYPMLADYLRVSVGKPEENDRLVKALSETIEGR